MVFKVKAHSMGRRQFLSGCIATGSAIVIGPAFAGITGSEERNLSFSHLHTGEKLKITYWAEGDYLLDSLAQINHLLRDHRTDEVHHMDQGLLDLLHDVQTKLGNAKEFQVVSGYRSPKTNKMLRSHSGGVAKHSLHMEGMAIDVRLPGRDLERLHQAAKSLQVGGVGLYQKSRFVHIDTGRVRYW